MKKFTVSKILFLLSTVLCFAGFAAPKNNPGAPMMKESMTPTTPAVEKVYAEMKTTFGMVPSFFKQFPMEALPGAWEEFKAIQLSQNGALSPKVKELMGLAVSAQIPCKYCTYFHTKAAMANGATKDELNFAVAESAMTRQMSAYVIGNAVPMLTFTKEIDRMVKGTKSADTMAASMTPAMQPTMTTAQEAYRDMEKTFGFVPSFMTMMPDAQVPGMWAHFKAIEMSTTAPIMGKVRDLIGLAVASQIPCPYCVYATTQFAKSLGASPQELQETIAMAGLVRHWSTVLNGIQQDETQFRHEIDGAFKFMQKNKSKELKTISQAQSNGDAE